MKYVLGIDQGGSKTHVMLADETGRILGMGQGSGACHSSHGMNAAAAAVEEAMKKALQDSGVALEQITSVAAGMTGVDWPEEADILKEALKGILGNKPIRVVNDCIIAMRAGTHKECSSILCAGSGLNCAVRKNKDIEFVYGFYIPDSHQGGSALGNMTLQAVFDAEVLLEEPTLLTQMVLDYFGLHTVDELLKNYVTGKIKVEEKLKLPILLEDAAKANDKVALEIFHNYGKEIAHYVIAGLKRFQMLDSDVDVLLSGSIFKCSLQVLQESVKAEIHRFAANAVVRECYYEPVVGAVLLALDELYEVVPEEIYHNIKCAESHFPIVRKKQIFQTM